MIYKKNRVSQIIYSLPDTYFDTDYFMLKIYQNTILHRNIIYEIKIFVMTQTILNLHGWRVQKNTIKGRI